MSMSITLFGLVFTMLFAMRALGASPEPAAAPAAAAVPLRPVAFVSAVDVAGAALFDAARAQLGDEVRELVIDPLIDASTGQQTVSSVAMGEQLARLVGSSHSVWRVQPLSRVSLARSPLLLIGTLTAIQTQASSEQAADSSSANDGY